MNFDPVIVAQGFSFTFNCAGWGVWDSSFGGGAYVVNGTTTLLGQGDRDGFKGSVLFKPTDDSDFSLQSFDSATMHSGQASGSLEIIGNLAGGGSVTHTINVTNSFANYLLPNTFVNLDSVMVRDVMSGGWQQTGGFSLDNVTYNAVPEPATLLVAGLGLLGVARRRRSAK